MEIYLVRRDLHFLQQKKTMHPTFCSIQQFFLSPNIRTTGGSGDFVHYGIKPDGTCTIATQN